MLIHRENPLNFRLVSLLDEWSVVQAMGIVNPLINEAVALAPMFAGAGDGHIRYWNCGETAGLITANFLGDSTTEYLGNTPTIKEVINRLNLVPGMTHHLMQNLSNHVFDKTLEEISFKDGSGQLKILVTPLLVHHVYVWDKFENCRFRGYVGLIHGDGLKQSVDLIKKIYC